MTDTLKKIFANSFFQGGMVLTASSFIVGLFNYLFNIIAARALGPVGYGEISALFSYLSVLLVPIAVIVMLIVQKIGSSGDNSLNYARSLDLWLNEKLKKWWFFLLLPLIITPFLPQLTNLSPVTAYSLAVLIIFALFSAFYDGAMQGLHIFFWFSIIGLIAVAIKLVGALLVLFTGSSLWVILLLLIISSVVKVGLSRVIFLRQIAAIKKTPTVKINKRIITLLTNKQLWTTLISILAITLLSNIDIIYVKKFFSAQQAGIYSSWSLFAKIILYFIGPLVSLSYIFFTSEKHTRYHQKTLLLSILFFLITGITFYIVYTYFASLVITVLFGEKFNSVIPYLSSASIFGILYVIIVYLNNYFLAKKNNTVFVLAAALPIYLIGLWVIEKNLASIMQLNIIFSLSVIILYGLIYAVKKL